MTENNPKGVKPDTEVVLEIKKMLINKGVDEKDWMMFLAKVADLTHAPVTSRAVFLVVSLFDSKTRDRRIVKSSHKGKYYPPYKLGGTGYKSGLSRDIDVLIAAGSKFINNDYWNTLNGKVKTDLGIEPFMPFIFRKADPSWAASDIKDTTDIHLWDTVLFTGGTGAAPTAAKKVKTEKVKAKTIPPTPTAAPAVTVGGCIEGADTNLKELIGVLQDLNETQGHKWMAGQKVKITGINYLPSGVQVVILNDNGDITAVPPTALVCFDIAVPAVAPPPPVAPPPEPVAEPEELTVTPETPPETVAAKLAKLEPIILPEDIKALGFRMGALLQQVQRRFMFANREDGNMFFASIFMKNGSCLLKGAPGTGKTTLLQLMSLIVSGRSEKGIDWRDLKNQDGSPIIADKDQLLDWMKEHEYFGMTQYNADKEPEDIFFRTNISIIKKMKNGEGIESENYVFEPTPREIVSAFLKLHNESNRLGPNTADALLGLLAERRVEYKGKFFPSPDTKKHPTWKGHLNYFDYNPHLDTEGLEMDRALLDRIDIGVYLPGGSLNTRFEILKKKLDSPSAGDLIQDLMDALREKDDNGNYKLNPVVPEDIVRLWKYVGKIPLDDEALRWIAFFTNLGNMTVRVYKEGAYFKLESTAPGQVPEPVPMTDQYIDPTVISYKGSKNQMTLKEIPQPTGTGGGAFPVMSTIDAFNRPLGSRAGLSLVALIQADTFIRYLRAEDKSKVSLAFIVNQRTMGKDGKWKNETPTQFRDRLMQVQKIIGFLPYVLDHRINIGVERDIQTNFLNFAHYIKHYFLPQVFFNKEKKYYQEWMTAASVMNDITPRKSDGSLKTPKELRGEWLEKFMEERHLGDDPETYKKGKLREDPFRMQWYDLAGAALEF